MEKIVEEQIEGKLSGTSPDAILGRLEVKLNIPYLNDRHYGKYGGRYVPELLIPALEELEAAFLSALEDDSFQLNFERLLRQFAGRPTPFFYAENLSKQCNGVQIYIKNEGNLATGAHKFNNALGQALLCKKLGKGHVIAETGAGQHGVAVASAAAKLKLKCTVFMGAKDMLRQQPNVFQMRQMGCEVVSVEDGEKTLKDAVNASLKYWIENLENTHYIIGSALGPFPFPAIVRTFQSVIGKEAEAQRLEMELPAPKAVVACVGGGSNSLGIFSTYIAHENTRLIGVEAGGKGKRIGEHAARFRNAKIAICQGYKSYFLQNEEGQLAKTHSISAGLDYAGISPELAHLHDIERVEFLASSDSEAISGYRLMAETEGIIPALECAHAAGKLKTICKTLSPTDVLILLISGRGDKDLFIAAPKINRIQWHDFLRSELSHY